ncbi:hypothetical protein SLA2020_172020 [Shorea laevis]
MAETILGPVIEEAVSKAISFATKQICLAWGFEKEVVSLKESLVMIQDVLQDAENKQEGDAAIRCWLQKLKDVAYDAMDVLDEYAYHLLQLKVETQGQKKKQVYRFFSRSNPIVFRCKMANKIKKINESLAKIKGDAVFPMLNRGKSTLCVSPIPETDSYLNSNPIGRSDDVSEIISQLSKLRSQHSMSVASIVGMAGIGKTTLAKSVFKEVKERKLYDIVAWVCVSDHFDEKDILGGMLESLDKTAGGINNIDAILHHLENELEGKTLLLVLDDVWNEESVKWGNFLDRLCKIVKTTGNSIIVTTRSCGVVSAIEMALVRHVLPMHKHEMKGLSDDECWSIIEEKVHRLARRPVDANLKEIGRAIARKCKGLPLVASVLGGTMGCEFGVEEWLAIKNNNAWNLLDDQNIAPILKISYDHLSGPLKKCFAFCSIFEKDTIMNKDELVQFWMAEGFLHPPNDESNLTMEDIGDRYFDDLLSNSLFQDIRRNAMGNVESCKMHDAVHDLALSISSGETLIWDQTGSIDENSKIRHLRVKSNGGVLPRGVSQKLHSLFLDAKYVFHDIPSDLKSLRSLTMLKACREEDLSISLGKMKHLRYLDISSSQIKVLPKSSSKLYNLQTLKLMWCNHLEKGPDDMRNFVSLRHLYFSSEKNMPKEIGHLTSLQTLPLFVVGREKGYRIEELGCLSQLRGELDIQKLEGVGSKSEASKAKLKEKKKLQGLKFTWCAEREANNNINYEEVLEGLQPHPNLKSLVIWNYQGKNFPSWMQGGVNSSLNNLMKLKLQYCKECLYLPSLGLLHNLQFLQIEGIKKVKSMGSKFYVDQSNNDDGVRSATQFPALREFNVARMDILEEWVEVEGVTVFPCLERLISRCHKLMAIPSMDGLLSLKTLYIEECYELMTLPSGLGSYTSLQKLRISRCKKLSSIQSINGLTSLTSLELSNCDELISLPSGLGSCTSLQELRIFGCKKLSSIPSINGLTSLTSFKLSNCDELMSLPSGLGSCISLPELRISGCKKLSSIPIINGLTSLTSLELCDCDDLMSLPSGLGSYTSLQKLRISGCKKLSSIPSINGLTSLTSLKLSNCDELMSLPSGLGSCTSLQELSISGCKKLSSIPSINGLTSLTSLWLYDCDELMSLPSGLGSCTSLQELSISRCKKLSSIPSVNGLTSLTSLQVYDCDELISLPSELGSCTSLQELTIYGCKKLSSIPSIYGLTSLRRLELYDCDELMSLPSELGSCTSLRELSISRCKKLSSIPSINGLTSLTSLRFYDCDELMSLPSGLGSCTSLQKLSIFGCKKLSSIPSINGLTSLTSLELSNCDELMSLPSGLGSCTSLPKLRISGCKKLSSIESINGLTSLRRLWLYDCDELMSLPSGLGSCTSLQELSISRCKKLSFIPSINGLTSLTSLSLYNCDELMSLPSGLGSCTSLQEFRVSGCKKPSSIQSINGLTSLTSLELSNCDELMNLPSGLGSCTSLQELKISRCKKLSSIQSINRLTSLRRLWFFDCDELMSLPSELGSCTSLQELSISRCKKLSSIPSIKGLTSLTSLWLYYCDELMSLSTGLGSCTSLQELRISGCKKLSSIQSINGLTSLTSLELSNCDELMSLPSELGSNTSLKEWSIFGCKKLSSIPSINGLTSLTSLRLYDCDELMSLPSELGSCTSLQELSISGCKKLSSILSINGLISLRRLELYDYDELTGLPIGLAFCTSLQSMAIWKCHNIISITEEIGELHSLTQLEIRNCGKLRSIPEECVGRLTCLKQLRVGGFWSELEEFSGLTYIHQLHASLEVLELNGWDKLKSLPHQLQHLTALMQLTLWDFNGLEALPEWLGDLSSLHRLEIKNCSNLTHLPSIEAMRRLSNLEYLLILSCPKLEERCAKESGPEWAKISHIPYLTIHGGSLQ